MSGSGSPALEDGVALAGVSLTCMHVFASSRASVVSYMRSHPDPHQYKRLLPRLRQALLLLVQINILKDGKRGSWV